MRDCDLYPSPFSSFFTTMVWHIKSWRAWCLSPAAKKQPMKITKPRSEPKELNNNVKLNNANTEQIVEMCFRR